MKVRLGVAALGAVLALAGCGSSGGVSNTPAPAASSASVDTPAGEEDIPTSKAPAKIGDPITLGGSTPGLTASVEAVKVVDPALSSDEYVADPAKGSRYVAVQFRINNTGTAVYDDSPSNGAKAIDADGQQFASTFIEKVDAGPAFQGAVKVTAGSRALGFVVFEVPKASKVVKVQFGMDSGMGESGEWTVP